MKYSELTIDECITIFMRHNAMIFCDADRQLLHFDINF